MILILLFLIVLFLNYKEILQRLGFKDRNLFAPLPFTIITFSLLIYTSTEVLSVGNHITPTNLFVFWSVALLISIGFLIIMIWKKRRNGKRSIQDNSIVSDPPKTDKKRVLLFLVFLAFSAGMIYFALRTPLYNWDSMCYHLTRVAMWAQHQSITHYATMDLRELTAPVLSEMLLLHIYELSGYKDILFNLPQNISYLLNSIMIFSIAKKIGCKQNWAITASVIFLAMPIAFAESLTTQNDLFTTLHLLCVTYIIIDLISTAQTAKLAINHVFRLCFLGIGLALSYHAKFYTVLPIAILLVWLLIVYIKKNKNTSVIIVSILISTVIAFLIYIPEGIRMINSFGSITYGEIGTGMITDIKINNLIATFTKNFFFNFTNQYIKNSYELVYQFVKGITEAVHVDLGNYIPQGPFVYDHDLANGFLVCLLFVFALPYTVYKAIREKRCPPGYVICTYISLLVFLIFLKHTPYRTRYELAFFSLIIPSLCLTFQDGRFCQGVKYGLIGMIVFVALCDMLSLYQYHKTYTKYMPNDREEGHFIKRGEAEYHLYEHFSNALVENNSTSLGIHIPAGTYVYPVFSMNREKLDKIEYVYVDNETSRYEDEAFHPDAILYFGDTANINGFEEGIILLHNEEYYIVDAPDDAALQYFLAVKR